MHRSLASVVLPEYRRRVLGLLLLQPDEALHRHEIDRRTGLPAVTITRELRRLAEVGLLRRQKRGNQQIYSADEFAAPGSDRAVSAQCAGQAEALPDRKRA